MNLRKRTILLLGATLFGSWVALYLLSSASLLNSFASLDEPEMRQNVERVREPLSARTDNFTSALNDWANWDDAAVAQEVAERLRAGIASLSFPSLQGEALTVTASLGAAPFDRTLPTLGALLDGADQALYQAKHAGRNRVMTWACSHPQPGLREETPQ